MSFRTRQVSTTRGDTRFVSFSLLDPYGRAIGCAVYCGEATFEEAAPDARSWCVVAPGHHWTARPQATRNGNPYGASQVTHYFPTAEERDAYADRFIAQSRKRAVKTYGGTR